ncbi:MAG TPA: MoaD/ThiS family protein [Microbacteriaceae bacterium]|nr:MoaD/ThiS family protein [Microbacteriaceae bacterium]
MDVLVRYFAAAADAAGREEESLHFAPNATLGDLRSLLEKRYTGMTDVLRNGSFLIDKVVRRSLDMPLAPRVDVLPPFAGG